MQITDKTERILYNYFYLIFIIQNMSTARLTLYYFGY